MLDPQRPPRCVTYSDEHGLELSDILRSGSTPRTWTTIKRDAGIPTAEPGPSEQGLLKRIRALAHVDDAERADSYVRLLRGELSPESLTSLQEDHARMLFYSLWPNGGGYADLRAGLQSLMEEPAVRAEMAEVIELSMDRTVRLARVPAELPGIPFASMRNISARRFSPGLRWARPGRTPNNFREGVVWVDEWQADAFFVTLNKSETEYSATTLYRDYRAEPDPVPLGVAVDDVRRVQDRAAVHPSPRARHQRPDLRARSEG